jgi:hypothetical protein
VRLNISKELKLVLKERVKAVFRVIAGIVFMAAVVKFGIDGDNVYGGEMVAFGMAIIAQPILMKYWKRK